MKSGPSGSVEWKVLLGEMLIARGEASERDPSTAEHYALPRVKASQEEISAFEAVTGTALPADVRDFLAHANGWLGCYRDLHLFGLSELRGEGAGVTGALLLHDAANSGTLAAEGLAVTDLLAVGVGVASANLVAVIRPGQPRAGEVLWIRDDVYATSPDFVGFFAALRDLALIETARLRPRLQLDPADDWPERTYGREAFGAHLDDLRAWADASPLRALSDNGVRLYLARRRLASRTDTVNVVSAPPGDGPGLWTLDTISTPNHHSYLILHPGVEVLRVGIDGFAAQLHLRLEPGLAESLGLTDSDVTLTVGVPQGTYRHGHELTEADLRDSLARLLAAGGISTPQIDTIVHDAIEDTERHTAAAAVAATNRAVAAAHPGRYWTLDWPRYPHGILRRAGLTDRADDIAALCRPALALRTADGDTATVGASRFGGCPDLPDGATWPEQDGKLYMFLLQLDLATLPEIPGVPLPRTGVLSFFAGHNETANDPGGLVCHHDGPLHRAALPHEDFLDEEGELLPERAVAITPVLRAPVYGSEAYDALELADTDVDAYLEACDDLAGRREREEVSFLAGYADSSHDLLSELTFAAHGRGDERQRSVSELRRKAPGSPAWTRRLEDWEWWNDRREEVAAEIHDWITLLVLDSHADAGMCWWDAGTLNFLIQHHDLTAGRFDRVRVVLTTS
ncbi:hypothetical protein Lfu02_00550 [Longispora fulva]|uniref:Knr4/Smi1-like domain-containing protein n=1 Tax=Longispora fulva TaxID=619741 RepID=A0A8J7GCH5_9ACTN|nr:DUF1963 domain-containing protein [Longispora fulva]MBG6136074.1 hypothetical protein [Longispora fulva]GIG55683.1 hypothetical protein Lfu02_00550 [Longispora fulva]